MKCALCAAGIMLSLWASPVAAADWEVNTGQSKLMFSGVQAGAGFDGQFRKFDAAIAFDPDHPEAAVVTITIHMASAVTGSDERDEMLAGPLWFDVKQFPTATFTASGAVRKGPNDYDLQGRLMLHGVSKQLRLPFTLEIRDGKAHAVGKLTLSRRDYGVGSGAWASDKWVGYKVAVSFDITAVAK